MSTLIYAYSCIRNGTFCLHEHIFKGGHGDIFRSYKYQQDKQTINKDISYVLKRMNIVNKPHIIRCAEREIYFGLLLQGQPHMPRLVTTVKSASYLLYIHYIIYTILNYTLYTLYFIQTILYILSSTPYVLSYILFLSIH